MPVETRYLSQNTFHTLRDMRIVFVDGTVLDTADKMRSVTKQFKILS